MLTVKFSYAYQYLYPCLSCLSVHLTYLHVFLCFCHIFTVFINDNRNREKITHESCDDREFREVVEIGALTDRYYRYRNVLKLSYPILSRVFTQTV